MKIKQLVFSILALVIFVVGCQETENIEVTNELTKSETNDTEESTNSMFPITVDSADGQVEINKKPEAILPLSLDVTEIVLELVEPERVVAISNAVEDEQLSTQTERAKEINQRISSATNIDPEEILSYDTDLLLLTKMHGQEEDANKVLSDVDLSIVTFNTMSTVETFLENVETIGKAVGETDKATNLIETLVKEMEAVQAKIPTDAESPSVLVLSEVGPGTGPFMMGPGNISYDLIKKAGATPAVDKIGLESSTPASIEQVLKMEPDYIFLLDFVGKGDEVFDELSENPGWDSLDAVKTGNIKVLDVKYLMNPNVKNVEGLEIMVDWIYELDE